MKLTQRIGRMAVIVDEQAGLSEVIDVDTIALISIVINPVTGVAQFALAFGGMDSLGKFHLDHTRAGEVAHVTISREGQQAMFDSLFRDPLGNPKTDYPAEFFDQLCEDYLLSAAHRMIWGAKYPSMEVLKAGQPIFSSIAGVGK